MKKGRMLYEGKAKQVFAVDDPGQALVYYKDDATAFNGEKKGVINSKGLLNNAISSLFFELLEKNGLETHFLKKIDDRSMLVKKLEIIPIEVVVRNIAAGSLAQRLGWEEGRDLGRPVVEFYYKDDALGDPLINRDHVAVLGLAAPAELDALEELGLKVNKILREYLAARNTLLVDFKLEFGRSGTSGAAGGKILLGDEISPDTCRFWDAVSREKLDKDRFRRDLGRVEEAYQEMFNRISG
ncbi:MAG: phosphoribosylaminoimidazolesuccinocarboxamide synthase [Candidatus Adiutrix sp.]|jgi:phosphoribosylaminoimidazole-succinocarboxamide synthase|nr:phosphoribosylaminoimidazolesuccinocarboxamide synthase [Candidatus Adiutrix sp.]